MSQAATRLFEQVVQTYVRIREHILGKGYAFTFQAGSRQRHQQALDRLLACGEGGQPRIDGLCTGQAEGLEIGGSESDPDPAPDSGLAGRALIPRLRLV